MKIIEDYYKISEERKRVIEAMANHLLGTCENEQNYMTEHNLELNSGEKMYLSEHIEACPDCGYWFRPTQLISGFCEDCYEEMLEAEMREAEAGEEEEDE